MQTYWNDFLAFLATKYPHVNYMHEVQKCYAEAYVMYLRKEGVFVTERHVNVGKKKKHYHRTKSFVYKHSSNTQLSVTTINKRHKALKAIFERLKEDAALERNPFNFDTLKNEAIARDIFNEKELELIFQNAQDPVIRAIFTIGLFTGLSLKDIAMLEWSHLQDGFIVRKRSKTKALLEIPIIPQLQIYFDDIRAQKNPSIYVVPQLHFLYQRNSNYISKLVRIFLDSIGIQSAIKNSVGRQQSIKSIHALRHTFAYFSDIAGISPSVVQSVLGHFSMNMTEKYQQHARREEKLKMFAKLSNIINIQTHNITKESNTL